jgi:triacylglycerol lipase
MPARTAGILAALALLAAVTPGQASSPGPRLEVAAPLLADALRCPHGTAHKVVLLVHGTSVTADENWSWNYVLALPHAGFSVCTVQLPDRELSDVQVSSEYVVYAIRTLAARTRQRIDVVGISQGALQPRWAIRWWPDIGGLVDDYVSMAGTNHGAVFADADCVVECPPALWQQVRSSRFLAALNAGDETPGRVSYTSVYSLTDEVIQPEVPTPAPALAGAANVAVQDICPGRYVGHVQSAADAVYFAIVLDALQHVGPADPSRVDRDSCLHVLMPHVDPLTAATREAEIYAFAGVVQGEHAKSTSEPALRPYARGRG